jgi:hypothetical protein
LSSGSHILALLSKHWWLNCSTFALQSSELWIKFTLYKSLPMSSVALHSASVLILHLQLFLCISRKFPNSLKLYRL